MRTSDIEEGRDYLVVLPYEGGRGIATVIQTGVPSFRTVDDLPYNGHGTPTVRVKWTANAPRYGHRSREGRIQLVRSNDIVRLANADEMETA